MQIDGAILIQGIYVGFFFLALWYRYFVLDIFVFIFFNTNLAIYVIPYEKSIEYPLSFLQGQVVISLEDQERMRDKEQIRCLRKMLFGPHLNRGNVT